VAYTANGIQQFSLSFSLLWVHRKGSGIVAGIRRQAMQKWEYRRYALGLADDVQLSDEKDHSVVAKSHADIDSYLARLGQDGWELVAVAGGYGQYWFFKRPKA
jgi:hypothetical protein